MNRSVIRLYAWAGLAVALVLMAAPASAQFKPRPFNDPATGETYHIEGGADLWRTFVSTGLTETAFTCTRRSRPAGTGSGNSTSINEAASELGSD